MPGPRKTRPQLRLLRGTEARNKHRDRSGNIARTSPLPALDAVPTSPGWLKNVDAVREWKRLAPLLVANGLLHEANLAAFGHACAVHGQLVASWAAGEPPSAALLAAYRALANSLALLDFPATTVRPDNPFADL